jgi:CRP/FNR family transcriptional regulator, cyclic AMP receptor protein
MALSRVHPGHSLEGILIFGGLSAEALERIQKRCAWQCYKAGETIIANLDSSSDVFFTIHAASGKGVSFLDLGSGGVFGEYPAIDGGVRSASVEARTNCRLASMSGRAFQDLLQREPEVAQALLPQLVARIRALTMRVYEFTTLAANNRVQAELLRLARLAPREGKAARIMPAPTHGEIASRISTHREAVTREFGRLARIGVVERCRGALVVTDVDRLSQMVHEVTGE